MRQIESLLQILADGKFHSGEDIASKLGCTRSAVWKWVRRLREIPGLAVDSVSGRGYRLQRPLDLLQRDTILDHVAAEVRESLQGCQVVGSVGSTNSLASQVNLNPGQGAAWFAEHQTAGRGRRGRSWVSPYGRNIYYSLAWCFDAPLNQVSGLSIACGAALAEVLHGCGLRDHGLKWPNDLLWQQRKLAGILLEISGETEGPSSVVIGVGINLDLDGGLDEQIGQPYASLRDAGLQVGRNRLAADLLNATVSMCHRFTESGLAPFLDTWRRFDVFQDRPVRLVGPGRELRGRSLGLADDGGLQLQIGESVQTHYSGELSLRAGDDA